LPHASDRQGKRYARQAKRAEQKAQLKRTFPALLFLPDRKTRRLLKRFDECMRSV
jgi:hypothetical protein